MHITILWIMIFIFVKFLVAEHIPYAAVGARRVAEKIKNKNSLGPKCKNSSLESTIIYIQF